MLLFILFRNRCALNLILLFYFIGDAKLSVVNIMVAGCSVLLEGDEVLSACGWHEIFCFLGERSDSTHLDSSRDSFDTRQWHSGCLCILVPRWRKCT